MLHKIKTILKEIEIVVDEISVVPEQIYCSLLLPHYLPVIWMKCERLSRIVSPFRAKKWKEVKKAEWKLSVALRWVSI